MAWSVCVSCIRVALLLAAGLGASAVHAQPFETLLKQGAELRRTGNLNSSVELLLLAKARANGETQRMLAAGELGESLLQARRPEAAEIQLRQAYDMARGEQRAAYALALGNLALQRRQESQARQAYEEARQLAVGETRLRVGLNLARLTPAPQRLAALAQVSAELQKTTPADAASLHLNLGSQAQALGPAGTALAYANLDRARRLSVHPSRVQIEALDGLAQLYEARPRESLQFNDQALAQAHLLPVSAVGEPLIALEWRAARLHTALGEPALALAAWQRAVDRIEALRPDIPIEFEDGNSSFRTVFEPVYMGLVDALLKAAERQAGAQASYLSRALEAVELIKQTEMQDYLGDRCTVDTVKGGTTTVIPAGTAVVYPLVFADRLELLVMTSSGVSRFTQPVRGEVLRKVAADFANELRNTAAGKAFMPRARQLYDWLLRPLESLLAAQQIDTLVLVPEGALRLVPIAVLHDGQRFAIEKYAVSTAAGLSMTNTTRPSSAATTSLLAGTAYFGPVVGRLMDRSPDRPATDMGNTRAVQETALRDSLALPGVRREIAALGRTLPTATSLYGENFTVEGFSRAASTGAYGNVHIASHGIFGGDAKSSYILAYDDLLTLDGLQQLLRSDQFRKHPLELLTLSACETADGNERAPLGISGAAIKARAKSVLGTLWPVNDDAAVKLMELFYADLAQHQSSKAQALRKAQRALIETPAFAHPFFWAPFALIGNWL